jgi:hypothetical protein
MCVLWGLIPAVSALSGFYNTGYAGFNILTRVVVPSNMNPVGAEGNIFSSLFDKVPARRAGNAEDIAGTVLYLVSKAGVSGHGTVHDLY